MIDLSYKPKPKPHKSEPEEIALYIFGTVLILANVIAFLAAL